MCFFLSGLTRYRYSPRRSRRARDLDLNQRGRGQRRLPLTSGFLRYLPDKAYLGSRTIKDGTVSGLGLITVELCSRVLQICDDRLNSLLYYLHWKSIGTSKRTPTAAKDSKSVCVSLEVAIGDVSGLRTSGTVQEDMYFQ